MYRLCTLFCILYELCTLFCVLYKLCTLFCVLYKQCTLFCIVYRLCTLFCIMYSLCTLFRIMYTLCTVHSLHHVQPVYTLLHPITNWSCAFMSDFCECFFFRRSVWESPWCPSPSCSSSANQSRSSRICTN